MVFQVEVGCSRGLIQVAPFQVKVKECLYVSSPVTFLLFYGNDVASRGFHESCSCWS